LEPAGASARDSGQLRSALWERKYGRTLQPSTL
jgi:hypothetical protein